MFSVSSLKPAIRFMNTNVLKPLVEYIVKNRLVFAALLYSLLLHIVECVFRYFADLTATLGNPIIQGLGGFLALFGLCLLAGGIPAKILLSILLLLQTLETFCAAFLGAVFSLGLRAEALAILAVSSPQEVNDFLDRFFTWKLFLSTLIVLAVYSTALYAVWKPKLKRAWALYAICGLLLLPQLINTIRFCIKRDYKDIYKHNSLAMLVFSYGNFESDMHKLTEMEKHPQLPPNIRYQGGSENLLAIVVIGESATRFHHSLYDYPRPTNPVLGAKEEVYAFTDVISAYAQTVRSFLYMMTAQDAQRNQDYGHTMYDVFKKAGFEVDHYSNQNRWGKYDSPISMLTAHADSRVYLQEHRPGSLDDGLVEEFRKRHPKTTRPTLAVFHLIGSHNSFDKRSPKERKVFDASNRPEPPYKVEDWNEFDEYDNSIRFTDHMQGLIADIVDAEPGPAFMLYCSDHGESPELFYSSPRSSKSKQPECYEIPFVFHANAAYREKYPETMRAIRENLHKPFVTDDLMYPVFSAARIDFDGFPRDRDLFSSGFVPRARRYMGSSSALYHSRRNPYLRSSAPAPKRPDGGK